MTEVDLDLFTALETIISICCFRIIFIVKCALQINLNLIFNFNAVLFVLFYFILKYRLKKKLSMTNILSFALALQ